MAVCALLLSRESRLVPLVRGMYVPPPMSFYPLHKMLPFKRLFLNSCNDYIQSPTLFYF